MYMYVLTRTVYSPLYLTTNIMTSKNFSDGCIKYEHPFRRVIFTHRGDFMATTALTVSLTNTADYSKDIQNSHRQFILIRIIIYSG